MMGPKVAPKPAHANDTTFEDDALFIQAMMIPITEMTSKVMRETSMTCFSVASFLNIPLKISRDSADEAMSRYESDELIVAASMPDMMMPARNAGSSPVDMMMNMFSDWLCVSSSAGYSDLPISPIATAANSEITHILSLCALIFQLTDLLIAEPQKDSHAEITQTPDMVE